jgi:hypothetical protein
MDPESYGIAPGERSRNQVLFHDLTLVKCREPKIHDKQVHQADQALISIARQHNFAIWALEKPGSARRLLHLYYCVRCKWTFQVDDRSGAVTPLDQDGNPLREYEASRRLATFNAGSCPVFRRPIDNIRITQVVSTSEAFRVRLVATLFHVVTRMWQYSNLTRHEWVVLQRR